MKEYIIWTWMAVLGAAIFAAGMWWQMRYGAVTCLGVVM